MSDRIRLEKCDTLLFDMDGTLLDLAFDNYMWMQHIPGVYAERHGLGAEEARHRLYGHYRQLQGQLDWYCLDHWSERLDLDILGLHRAQRSRIGWLPGAESFLGAQRTSGRRVLMVTNSHRDTLDLKAEVTGIDRYFDGIYSAHDFGYPKEQQAFWTALQAAEHFDPARTLFVDDTESVLESAERYGLSLLVRVLQPDTTRAPRACERYAGVVGVAELG